MSTQVICISRTLYSGAEEVATEVAGRLGYRYVDEEIVARAAERQKAEVAAVAETERRKPFFARLFESDDLRRSIREAIIETADEGRAVIVAHAASYALGHRFDVLRVLVTSSPAMRARRLADAQGKSVEEAAEAVKASDTARADYLAKFYGVAAESPEHYDLTISTDVLTPAQAAAVVLTAAQLLAG